MVCHQSSIIQSTQNTTPQIVAKKNFILLNTKTRGNIIKDDYYQIQPHNTGGVM